MEVIAPLFILASALALIFYLRSRARRRGGSSFMLPPHDYSDTSDDGLGSSAYPPQRLGKRESFDKFDDLMEDEDTEDDLLDRRLRDATVRGTPDAPDGPPQGRIVRPRRVSPDDRRPANGGDVLLNTLLYGAPTGAPIPRDEVRAVVPEVLREEGAVDHRRERRDGDDDHRVVGRHDDIPESTRSSDGDGRSGFGGGSSNFSSPDPGGSPGGDSGGGGGGE